MSKAVKALIVDGLRQRYGALDSAAVVDTTGMNVSEQERLRRMLRKKSARLEVVKNSLARRAFQDSALKPLGEVLEGPCALVTTSASIVDVAKLLVEAGKEFPQLKLRFAVVEGDSALLTVAELSKLKTRAQAIGELLMLVCSPGRALASCLRSPQAKIAGCVKFIADKAA